jgi:hypothetical protein
MHFTPGNYQVNRYVIGLRHLITIACYFSNVINSLIECNTNVSVPCYRHQTAGEQSSYQLALLDVFTTILDLILVVNSERLSLLQAHP